MKKSIIAILTTAMILSSMIVAMLNIHTVQAEDPASWYTTVTGVLDTDTYWLYPYEKDYALNIGFSKYGELINGIENIGLEYGEVDPFAPPAGSATTTQVPERMWLNGWLINITYVHRTLGLRNVWACALYSDSVQYGRDWLRVDFDEDYSTSHGYEDPRDQGYLIGVTPYPGTLYNGGRKTNGTCVTDPITVLYDGPRKFVAVMTTTVYDHPLYLDGSTEADVALLKVMITIVFNKVKKEVILYKDVKSILAWKEGEKMKIEFSNRGEVDLGIDSTGYGSYAHFYTDGTWSLSGFPSRNDTYAEGFDTVYTADWQLTQTEDPADTDYPDYSADGPYPQLTAATFDVAQAINEEAGYTWFGAFWPSLSDWSIDGWDEWWHSLHTNDPHYIDFRVPDDEPFIPFYIGEWDFILYHTLDTEGRIQFRGVTVYGLTNQHDAEDWDMPDVQVLVPDREVLYQLNEVFNPWDLYDAIEKNTTRIVEYSPDPIDATSWTLYYTPFWYVEDDLWDQYCVFSERVEDLTTGEVLNRYEGDYSIVVEDGSATLQGLDEDDWYKVLYSITPAEYPGRYEWGIVGRDAASVDSAGLSLVSAAFKNKGIEYGLAGADMYDSEIANQMPWIMDKIGTGNLASAYYYDNAEGDYRTALRDDWCYSGTISGDEMPIASSNIAGVGGPLANVFAWYGNDFTDAFYGLDQFTDAAAWENQIDALSCWNKNAYESSNGTGYAIVSTYKDINGTVLFLIWGHWGRDTFYATKWFHEDGKFQLQEAPLGITSLIIEIEYESTGEGYKPTDYSIVEVLGTISERLWEHTEDKGGIHDP